MSYIVTFIYLTVAFLQGGNPTILNSKPSQKSSNSQEMNDKELTYLALGDSYTIGEGVEESGRYPNQLIKRLREETLNTWENPKIIAKTGWTVDELKLGINEANLSNQTYDLVTLLIGVNNQYRGRSLEDYRMEFESMLHQAIVFAGGKKEHVFVLSIPDWGVTPFAINRQSNQLKVANEIDAFNQAKKEICDKYGVAFLNITSDYREIGAYPDMVVADQLHPSKLVYEKWADVLFQKIKTLTF
jgi:lysophospholipase L1-like esterase